MPSTLTGVTARTTWPRPELIESERLILEPLRVSHADEMAPALNDAGLHTFIGGRPATVAELRDRYAAQVVGQSPDGRQGWLNWILRHRHTGEPVGTVQATLTRDRDRCGAELAWVVAVKHQRRGYAQEAATAMAGWLREHGVAALIAHIDPAHQASMAIATRLGMHATGVTVDGETRWTT
jgi:RimJ/RimL family protein N-acetyltransferase